MKYLLFIATSLLFLSFTMERSANEFTSIDLIVSLSLIGAVLISELIISRLFARNTKVQRLILSTFLVANLYCMNLVLISQVNTLNSALLSIILVVAIGVCYSLDQMCEEFPKLATAWLILSLTTTAGFAAAAVLNIAPTLNPFDGSADSGAQHTPAVKFKKKPNIYIVAFDALTPQAITSKYLNLPELPHQKYFNATFKTFKNFFADDVPTKQSLNSLLAFDRSYYLDLVPSKNNLRFYQGNRFSPFLSAFKNNGYKTNTVFNSRYFGRIKGPHVDAYLVNKSTGACEFIDPAIKPLFFFGYCKLEEAKWFKTLFQLNTDKSDIDFLVDAATEAVIDPQPNIFVAYLYTPGHSKNTFQYSKTADIEEYKAFYSQGSSKAAKYLKRLVKFVEEQDPTAILFIFGDHGSMLSREVTISSDPTFYILDKYAVLAGVYTSNTCANKLSSVQPPRTPMHFAHQLIECLSEQKLPYAASDFDQPVIWNKRDGFSKPHDYKDYSYE